jgi:hypothetical protein
MARWITNSAEAEIFLVFANVDPSKGYKGITCFVLDKDMGIQIAKKEKKVSPRALSGKGLFLNPVNVGLMLWLSCVFTLSAGYQGVVDLFACFGRYQGAKGKRRRRGWKGLQGWFCNLFLWTFCPPPPPG